MLYPESRTDLLEEADVDANRWATADSQTRAQIHEEKIAPHLLERRGYRVLCSGGDCPGGDNGIDIMAWDPKAKGGDGDLVVAEAKYSNGGGSAGPSAFGSSRDVDGSGKAKQMTDDWIQDSWESGNRKLDTDGIAEDIKSRYGDADSVDDAIDRAMIGGPEDGYTRKGIFAKDNRNGKTVSTDSAKGPEGEQYYMTNLVENVEYLKLGKGGE